jgi:azurin
MRYELTEITVKAGTKVKLIMDNIATAQAMLHNVVIAKPGSDVQAVGIAGMTAGPENDYIPQDEAVLFYTAMTKPGMRSEIEFTAPPAGDYPYLCTFPGHFALMKGVMHSVD